MIYNICGFNQEKLINITNEKGVKLNCNDLIVLKDMLSLINRMDKITVDDKEYSWIRYSLLVENLPFISDKEDTFKKIITKLINCGFIERIVKKNIGHGAKVFFRATDLLISITYNPEEEKEETKKPSKKKKEAKKVNVDSNGNEPIEGQINDIEALGIIQDEKVKMVNDKLTIGKASEELIDIIKTKTIEEVDEVLKNINTEYVTSSYIENAFKVSKNNNSYRGNYTSNNTKRINPMSFNNFEPREYDYDKLEKMLLGWYDDEEQEVL